MNLQEEVQYQLALFKGRECEFEGGMDIIEKVKINGAAFGGTSWTATLKYGGDVDMNQVTLR